MQGQGCHGDGSILRGGCGGVDLCIYCDGGGGGGRPCIPAVGFGGSRRCWTLGSLQGGVRVGVCVPISPPLCPPPPPQMNRPIQVKPADSESRGGTSTHPLPPPWPRPHVPKPPPIPPTRVTPHPAPGRVSPPQGSVPMVEGPHFCPHPLPTTLSLWTRVGVPSPVPILGGGGGVPAHHSVPLPLSQPCPHHHVPTLGIPSP